MSIWQDMHWNVHWNYLQQNNNDNNDNYGTGNDNESDDSSTNNSNDSNNDNDNQQKKTMILLLMIMVVMITITIKITIVIMIMLMRTGKRSRRRRRITMKSCRFIQELSIRWNTWPIKPPHYKRRQCACHKTKWYILIIHSWWSLICAWISMIMFNRI